MTIRAKSITLYFALATAALGAACTVTSGTVDDNTPTTSTKTSDGGTDSGSDASTGDAGAGDSGGGTCTLGMDFSAIGPDCNSCAGTNCCDSVNACANEKDEGDMLGCLGYLKCFNACQDNDLDAGSPADCVTQFCDPSALSGAIEKFKAWNTCLDTSCSTECPAGG